MDRHHRQMRLPIVGKSGQRAIAEAELDVTALGIEGMITARYLAGAGVMRLRTADEGAAAAARAIDARVEAGAGAAKADAPMVELDDLDPAAREVARGARAAVQKLVRVLRDAGRGTE